MAAVAHSEAGWVSFVFGRMACLSHDGALNIGQPFQERSGFGGRVVLCESGLQLACPLAVARVGQYSLDRLWTCSGVGLFVFRFMPTLEKATRWPRRSPGLRGSEQERGRLDLDRCHVIPQLSWNPGRFDSMKARSP